MSRASQAQADFIAQSRIFPIKTKYENEVAVERYIERKNTTY